jgi:hypothetical protein
MAITLSQFPTSPNMANNNLLFTVSSNTSSAAQYQFVATISLSGSSSGASGILQTIKQQPNPNGFGVFDVGQIISNYVDSDNNWKTAQFSTASEAGKRFQVKLGEEYASSISGTVTQYTGIGNNVGLPAVTASAYQYIANGLVEPDDKVNWNFPSASYYDAEYASDGAITYNLQNTLSNAPLIKSIQDGEYETISLFNGNFPGVSTASVYAQDIFEVEFKVYNSSNTLVQTTSSYNSVANGGGPRTNPTTQLWGDVFTSQSAGQQLLTIGVGPANIDDWTSPLTASWAYYDVTVYGQSDDGLRNDNGIFASRRYLKQEPQCGYDGIRFAWKNEFGVWDYYTFTLQNTKATNIERQQFEQSFVNFSTPNPSVAYDRQRRGKKPFYNKLTSNQTANSNWLDQGEADWLKELFFSTNVFIQEGTNFFPIAITTANLVEKTNPRTQKTFQYVIEFQAANQPTPRI